MKENQLYDGYKKCGGFFFLFFLHGFSIGNGQQGISYNVPSIADGGITDN